MTLAVVLNVGSAAADPKTYLVETGNVTTKAMQSHAEDYHHSSRGNVVRWLTRNDFFHKILK